mgnify:CR=1 FL=1
MVIVIRQNTTKKEMQQKIRSIKSSKLFDPKKFAGKINWGEDALKFQKRLRDEWS